MKNQKHFYFSNCMIEAFKAKIRSPGNVKLKYVPARLNDVFMPHFMWITKWEGKEYLFDFQHVDKDEYKKWWKSLWYKGYIRVNLPFVYDEYIKQKEKHKYIKGIKHVKNKNVSR